MLNTTVNIITSHSIDLTIFFASSINKIRKIIVLMLTIKKKFAKKL